MRGSARRFGQILPPEHVEEPDLFEQGPAARTQSLLDRMSRYLVGNDEGEIDVGRRIPAHRRHRPAAPWSGLEQEPEVENAASRPFCGPASIPNLESNSGSISPTSPSAARPSPRFATTSLAAPGRMKALPPQESSWPGSRPTSSRPPTLLELDVLDPHRFSDHVPRRRGARGVVALAGEQKTGDLAFVDDRQLRVLVLHRRRGAPGIGNREHISDLEHAQPALAAIQVEAESTKEARHERPPQGGLVGAEGVRHRDRAGVQTDQPVIGGRDQRRRPGFVCADVRERIAKPPPARVDDR